MISSNLDIKIVIGSWGSYNACNSRALGSTWLDLSKYTDWEQIEEELKKQGFKLEGIDEELFIQDIDGLPSDCCNWDYMSPKRLFEILMESDVLYCDYKYEILQAFWKLKTSRTLKASLTHMAQIGIWTSTSLKIGIGNDYGRDYYQTCNGEISSDMDNYFDFERYGEDVGYDTAHKYSEGIIVIYE